MKYVLILILFVAVAIGATLLIKHTYQTDEQTKELCRWYAGRDHEKEIDPQRYKWLGKNFVNNYDWYNSCINHVKYPVGGK